MIGCGGRDNCGGGGEIAVTTEKLEEQEDARQEDQEP